MNAAHSSTCTPRLPSRWVSSRRRRQPLVSLPPMVTCSTPWWRRLRRLARRSAKERAAKGRHRTSENHKQDTPQLRVGQRRLKTDPRASGGFEGDGGTLSPVADSVPMRWLGGARDSLVTTRRLAHVSATTTELRGSDANITARSNDVVDVLCDPHRTIRHGGRVHRVVRWTMMDGLDMVGVVSDRYSRVAQATGDELSRCRTSECA